MTNIRSPSEEPGISAKVTSAKWDMLCWSKNWFRKAGDETESQFLCLILLAEDGPSTAKTPIILLITSR